ncbi:MAG: Nucleotide sugar dehydrogenase [Parcubacteria group bacterium GW2011_GWA2_33_14]|uniref:UDP-glucose/GDP-mannose dehydrogenase dimerisation domain-containing protein n=1 Tax=Candidatus Staskawiczbacteria bacterium RIFCSPHIGHO2_02_FULL_33_16 TaxID=1802204 RepID=A0A1G2HY99_9BACT|nr:MAG: Nucleotide sugar dehydrogenase [Parcubacteria group bacterium GW2011_GWA2_33_14]OGZ67171.1 MAG: hypothetical protein A3D34_01450 [Candidatus Staskawiczbacteria bacterium RIFCSPHIGHO2_02_FULL_33_16]OGZ70727.1 MAG: hypothetical protein A2980_01365 [Candidatus Staskawiczbacteria bacterium RIFCSPLOWO2_01_FULL_33_13]
MEHNINIIGYGFVGQATAIGLMKLGYKVTAYDICQKENIYNIREFEKIDLKIGKILPEEGINIVCIADKTLENGKQEVSHLLEVLNDLNGKGSTILRTTILPRFFADHNVDFYWPEFLREKTAIEDFLHPAAIVVGRKNEKRFPFEDNFPVYYCTPEEASHIKYLHNIWNALRIAFVNEFGDNLIKENVNMQKVVDFIFKKEKYLKWGNAFGGHCLPKDIKAYSCEYPEILSLHAAMKSNKIHKDKYPELDKNPIF